ncbi:hypothetical protein ACJ5H2_22320 (plasmid) [Nocardioides sp. R1-1]|uniref:hypothetical protein n=1 Tax=Nocardioides sp. R1-1 TaxID=3383502 RepID=UPI0038D1585C
MTQLRGSLYAVITAWHRTGDDWQIICMDGSRVEGGFVPREQRTTPNVYTYPPVREAAEAGGV